MILWCECRHKATSLCDRQLEISEDFNYLSFDLIYDDIYYWSFHIMYNMHFIFLENAFIFTYSPMP